MADSTKPDPIRGLPENAYRPLREGEKYEPLVPAGKPVPEVSTRSVLLGLAMTCLAGGPSTINEISRAIIQKDRSLDVRCAKGLAEGVVQALSDIGEVELRESLVYKTSSPARP